MGKTRSIPNQPEIYTPNDRSGRKRQFADLPLSASSSPSRKSAFGYAADDRSAAYCRRRPRFNQTVAALCPRGRIASKFAITIHQSNLTKSLKISCPQLFPRACTSSPPSESPPTLIGEKPRFSASAPISAAAPSSSLARNTTLLPPCTAGSWSRTAATKWLKPLTSLPPVKVCATALEEGCPPSFSGGTP